MNKTLYIPTIIQNTQIYIYIYIYIYYNVIIKFIILIFIFIELYYFKDTNMYCLLIVYFLGVYLILILYVRNVS